VHRDSDGASCWFHLSSGRLARAISLTPQLSLASLDQRLRIIEDKAISGELLHAQLIHNDSATASAVQDLTKSLNDPKTGLIVELDRFRAEVIADRAAFRAWVRGATAVISVVFTIVTVLAPWLRDLIAAVTGLRIQ
jgi:hypothetical protein